MPTVHYPYTTEPYRLKIIFNEYLISILFIVH